MGRPRKENSLNLPENVYLKHGAFYYVYPVTKKWVRIGTDIKEIKKFAADASKDVEEFGTFEYWYARWIKEYAEKKLAPRTISDYKKDGVYLCAAFGKMRVSSIQPKHITKYIQNGAQDRSVRVNREKAAMSSCLTWLKENGFGNLVSTNPCKDVKRNPEQARERYVTDAEFTKVYELAGPSVKAWMQLIYKTLQRPSDVLSWTNENLVKEGNKTILTFRQFKTQKQMKIEVTEDLQKILDAAKKRYAKKEWYTIDSEYLICQRDGKPYSEDGGGLRSMFARHVKDAGVKDFGIYDSKSKSATDMYEAGVPLSVICALCGHESESTTEIYIRNHRVQVVQPNSKTIVK